MERVAERGAGKAAGMDGNLAACHHTLTQTQRDVGIDRKGRFHGDIQVQLHGGIFLCVETHASMQLYGLPSACGENDTHTVALRNQTAFGSLVKQIHTHRRGEFLL